MWESMLTNGADSACVARFSGKRPLSLKVFVGVRCDGTLYGLARVGQTGLR